MSITKEHLEEVSPEQLYLVFDRLRLIGMILGQLGLLEVVLDPDAGATAKATAARALTQLGEEPQTIVDRLKSSPLASKSPDELRALLQEAADAGDVTLILEDG